MTCQELYEFVSRLCDENGEQVDDVKYYQAATSALRQVNALRPAERKYILFHNPIKPSSFDQKTHSVMPEKPLVVAVNQANSMAAWCSGSGTVHFENANGERVSSEVYTWDEADAGHIACALGFYVPTHEEEIYAVFSSNVPCRVRGITHYDEYTSSPEPFSYWTEYKMRQILGDSFVDFACPPIKVGETRAYMNDGFVFEGSILFLSFDQPGTYEVWYRRNPTPITGKEPGEMVDLDPDLADLLPHLIAYYMLSTEDIELAGVMKRRYDELTLGINRRTARAPLYQVRGWR